jgi:hypothetical protein
MKKIHYSYSSQLTIEQQVNLLSESTGTIRGVGQHLSIFALENGEGGKARRGHVDAETAKWWVANPTYKNYSHNLSF